MYQTNFSNICLKSYKNHLSQHFISILNALHDYALFILWYSIYQACSLHQQFDMMGSILWFSLFCFIKCVKWYLYYVIKLYFVIYVIVMLLYIYVMLNYLKILAFKCKSLYICIFKIWGKSWGSGASYINQY